MVPIKQDPSSQTTLYPLRIILKTMTAYNGGTLLFRWETEEYIFEQWDLSGSIPTETDPKARAN